MSTPPFLLAGAALLWASQTGGVINWALALLAAALLEGPRVTRRRWSLSLEDFNRVSDFCVVLALAIGAYLYFTFGNPRAITLLFQWLPIVLLPLALAQAWSTSAATDLSVVFWALRRERPRVPMTLDLAWPCFALWLLGASAANSRSPLFYAGLVVLCFGALFTRRPRSFPLAAWAGVAIAAAALGYAGQWGLREGHLWVESTVTDWLVGSGTRTDPQRSSTDIGSIGELKSSDAIVLRVERDGDRQAAPPLLLLRASYDEYANRLWLARSARFEGVAPEPGGRWTLAAGTPGPRMTIHDFSPAGNPVLSLPSNAVRIEGLTALGLRLGTLGATLAERPPGYFSYTALVDQAAMRELAPTALDRRLPAAEAATMRKLAAQWGLEGAPPEQALERLRARFAADFSYSLYRKDASAVPLDDFLLSSRAGHCEYFATATVLLLRAAGIPARYATGYSVQEFSRLENAWIARERHAHAWARAWIGGRWIDVDTTPADWVGIEAAQSSGWSALHDLGSWAHFALARAFLQLEDERAQRWLIGLALALSAFVAWRVLRRRQSSIAGPAVKSSSTVATPGADSPFYEIERRLSALGWRREPAETIGEWLARLDAGAIAGEPAEPQVLAGLHLRYRFDPLGLDADSRAALTSGTAGWLERHPAG